MNRKQRNKLIGDTIVLYRQQYQSLLKTVNKELASNLMQSKIYGFVDCLRQLRVVEIWTLPHICDEMMSEVIG